MLHHCHRRLVEVSDNSKSMTSILDIRGRWAVFSPFDPVHAPYPGLRGTGLVQCGLLVRVRRISQSTMLSVDPLVHLAILDHLSPDPWSHNFRKVRMQGRPDAY